MVSVDTLFYYTTETGFRSIVESGILHPSLKRKVRRDALYGDGQYFTDIAPERVIAFKNSNLTPEEIDRGCISLLNLGNRIMGALSSPNKLYFYIEFDVSNLLVKPTRSPYIYLHESDENLDVSQLIIRYGGTPWCNIINSRQNRI
jgi:hypothetical protein